MEPRSDLQVPLICELMPMRWSYEALVFAQAKLNPLTSRQEKIQKQINKLADLENPTDAEDERMEDLKDLLAVLSGLRDKDARSVDRRFKDIDAVIAGGPFDRKNFRSKGGDVTAEQLYTNTKITDLVSKAEMEQTDYRNDRIRRHHLNVFFGPTKEYLGLRFSVLWFNFGVLILSTLALFFVLYLILVHQVRSRRI